MKVVCDERGKRKGEILGIYMLIKRGRGSVKEKK